MSSKATSRKVTVELTAYEFELLSRRFSHVMLVKAHKAVNIPTVGRCLNYIVETTTAALQSVLPADAYEYVIANPVA